MTHWLGYDGEKIDVRISSEGSPLRDHGTPARTGNAGSGLSVA
jgi:hypothetical protein